MINITKLSLFPKIVRQVTIGKDKKHHIIFFSENSTFQKVYDMLKIKRNFIRKVSFPPYKVPRLIFEQSDVSKYKSMKLIPFKALDSNQDNIFIDTSKFLDLVDSKYGKKSYQRSIVLTKIIDYLNECRYSDAENILLYHVDLSKDLPKLPQLKRSWALISMAKAGDGRFPFDCVIVCFTLNGNVRYFSIYNKNMKSLTFSKIFNVIKGIKKGKVEEPKSEEKVVEEPEPKEEPKEEESLDLLESSFTSTKNIINTIKQNKELMESNRYLSNSLKILQQKSKRF